MSSLVFLLVVMRCGDAVSVRGQIVILERLFGASRFKRLLCYGYHDCLGYA